MHDAVASETDTAFEAQPINVNVLVVESCADTACCACCACCAYTRILLENPIIVRNSHAARVHVRAVTDAAVAAAGTTINPDGLRGLGRVCRAQDIMKEQRRT